MVGVIKVDYEKSNLNFFVRHIIFSKFMGNFSKFDVDLKGDLSDPSSLAISVDVDVSSIDAHMKMLNRHLKEEPVFFNVSKYPTATFESTKITKKGSNKLLIRGNLSIKDVKKEIVIDSTYTKEDDGIKFEFETKINRGDFHLRSPSLMDKISINVSEEVKIYGVLFVKSGE